MGSGGEVNEHTHTHTKVLRKLGTTPTEKKVEKFCFSPFPPTLSRTEQQQLHGLVPLGLRLRKLTINVRIARSSLALVGGHADTHRKERRS